MVAMRAQQMEMVEFLIDNGVDYNYETTLIVSTYIYSYDTNRPVIHSKDYHVIVLGKVLYPFLCCGGRNVHLSCSELYKRAVVNEQLTHM